MVILTFFDNPTFSPYKINSIIILVEPEYTKTETVIIIKCSEIEEGKPFTVETMASVPFLSELNHKEDLTVSFNPEDSVSGTDLPLARLIDWNVTDSDGYFLNPMLCCQFEMDSEKVLKLDQLPILEVNVTTKDGTRKHLHATALELGKSFEISQKRFELGE